MTPTNAFEAYRDMLAAVINVCEQQGIAPGTIRADVHSDTYEKSTPDAETYEPLPFAGEVTMMVYGQGAAEERIPRDLDLCRRLGAAFGIDTTVDGYDSGRTVSWSHDRDHSESWFDCGFPVRVSVFASSPNKPAQS